MQAVRSKMRELKDGAVHVDAADLDAYMDKIAAQELNNAAVKVCNTPSGKLSDSVHCSMPDAQKRTQLLEVQLTHVQHDIGVRVACLTAKLTMSPTRCLPTASCLDVTHAANYHICLVDQSILTFLTPAL